MKVFVGQTRGRREEQIDAMGFGEMTQPSEWPPRRTANGWASDNEVFAKWKAGTPFDDGRHLDFLQRLHHHVSVLGWWEVSRSEGMERLPAVPPRFIVLPDVVADGRASFRKSMEWLPWMEPLGWPLFFVVQDGMRADDVAAVMPDVDGLFVGGSSSWKWATAAAWGALCLDWGRPLHIGRVGTGKRARWAREIESCLPGLELSVDSTIPLWSEDNMRRFCVGLETSPGAQLIPRHVEAATLIGYRTAARRGCARPALPPTE